MKNNNIIYICKSIFMTYINECILEAKYSLLRFNIVILARSK